MARQGGWVQPEQLDRYPALKMTKMPKMPQRQFSHPTIQEKQQIEKNITPMSENRRG
jgi:hypothetical protein